MRNWGFVASGFEFGELTLDLLARLTLFPLLHGLVELVEQETEVDAATLRCPLGRLLLDAGQREFLVQPLLKRRYPDPLFDVHLEGRDRESQWDIELELWGFGQIFSDSIQ